VNPMAQLESKPFIIRSTRARRHDAKKIRSGIHAHRAAHSYGSDWSSRRDRNSQIRVDQGKGLRGGDEVRPAQSRYIRRELCSRQRRALLQWDRVGHNCSSRILRFTKRDRHCGCRHRPTGIVVRVGNSQPYKSKLRNFRCRAYYMHIAAEDVGFSLNSCVFSVARLGRALSWLVHPGFRLFEPVTNHSLRQS